MSAYGMKQPCVGFAEFADVVELSASHCDAVFTMDAIPH